MSFGRFQTRAFCMVLSAILACCVDRPLQAAAPSAEQIQKLHAADGALTKAELLYKENKMREAAAAFTQAQDALVEVAAAPELAARMQPLKKRLVGLHDMMELDGAKVPAVAAALASAAPNASSTKPAATKPAATKPVSTKPVVAKTPVTKPLVNPLKKPVGGAGGVSFVRDVAPMLVAKCGRCHVDKNSGMFSMASYTALMRGAKNLSVVMAGDGKGSRIYEVIEQGDMPRGGGKVELAELTTLTKWIDQGAKFDGKDPTQGLKELVGPGVTTNMAMQEKLEVMNATGKESVRFSRDIAPVLVDNCVECHGAANNPGGALRLDTFNGLLIGGNSGLIVLPGKAATSLLLRKIKGTAGDRMPKGKPALSADVIAKFEKWIAEGAHFDSPDPKASLEMVADIYRAEHSTHEELSAERLARAKRLWRLAIPDDPGQVKETKNFAIIGNVSPATLDEVATLAESQAAAIARRFKAPEDKPLVKGKMTLFVCRQHFDYTEFGKMVETRELTPNAQGHFRYTVINAYGCIVPPAPGTTNYSLTALVTQQVAGLYVASMGRSPAWFAEGVGAATALNMDKTDGRLRGWEAAIPGIISSTPNANAFLNHGLATEVNDCLSMGFAKSLMGNASRFQQLLNAIKQGDDFETVFRRIYRLPPAELAAAWAARAG
jgi:hypothetical protein